jgi:hypothetical protein
MKRGLAFLKTVGAALVPRLLGLAIALFGFYSFFFAEPKSHVVVINRELGISGEVAVRSDSRGYRIYLDSSRVPYSFDEFTNEQLAPNEGLRREDNQRSQSRAAAMCHSAKKETTVFS